MYTGRFSLLRHFSKNSQSTLYLYDPVAGHSRKRTRTLLMFIIWISLLFLHLRADTLGKKIPITKTRMSITGCVQILDNFWPQLSVSVTSQASIGVLNPLEISCLFNVSNLRRCKFSFVSLVPLKVISRSLRKKLLYSASVRLRDLFP